MKVLRLKDGTCIQFTNNSSINNLITVVSTFDVIESLRTSLSQDNLSECNFDGKDYTDILLNSVSAFANDYGNVQTTFSMKSSSDAEIEELKQKVQELTDENKELIKRNDKLSDKAEAADILMGNEEV